MADFEINHHQIPLWTSGNGKLVLKTAISDGNLPLTPGSNPILESRFDLDGAVEAAFGGTGTVQIGIDTTTSARLTPVWEQDRLLLVFQAGAASAAIADGSYRFSILSAAARLKAGTDASFTYVRPFAQHTAFNTLLQEFFSALKLPAQVETPPAPGELVAFEYGGYLKIGATASAGYDIKGTKSIDLRDLKLSEHYKLGVVGTLAIDAKLAGRYAVEVRRGSDDDWARLTVRRSRSREFPVAADLQVNTALRSEGLPESGKEFLGALLGVNGKNWLNLIDSAAAEADTIQNIEALKKRLDPLASSFVERYAGTAIDSLPQQETAALLGRLNQAVASYRTLDERAIALYDRFWYPATNRIDELTSKLESLAQLNSWESLSDNDPLLWNTLRQLSPELDSLPELRKRAADALSLIRDTGHIEIRSLIQLARNEFSLDHFFTILASIDSPQELKTVLSDAAKGFVRRLIGQTIDSLGESELKKAFEIVKEVSSARERFWTEFDNKLRQAADQALTLAITSAYNSADEHTALIDVEIRLRKNGEAVAGGQQLLRAASNGDFGQLLAQHQPDLVRVHEGLLTKKIAQAGGLHINIAGWHRNFDYSAAWRVVTQSLQQIRTSATGALTVFTEVDMALDAERRRKTSRSEETMHTNFVLRYLGETQGAIANSRFDAGDKQYAIEVITGQAAHYQCTFTDDKTTPEDLARYLAFANALGLDKAGATAVSLAPMLRKEGNHFGPLEVEYTVRFNDVGLGKLFAAPTSDAQIRTILRRIVVANYIGKGSIAGVAALYASDVVRKLYERHRNNFIHSASILGNALQNGEVIPEPVVPGVRFPSASNDLATRALAAGLLDIERDLIRAFHDLRESLTGGVPIPLGEFERRMQRFGAVLNRFDQRHRGDNTVFAVIDGLIALSTASLEARSSSMALSFKADGEPRKMLFLLQAREVAASGPLPAVAAR